MGIINTLNNKKILIWGYGREGKSSESFINNHCPNTKYDIYEGDIDNINIDDYDLIIKSPGIPYISKNKKFTSQTELFLNEFRNQTIAITGSKGKSTTSTLLYKVLLDANIKSMLVGNIGNPCLSYYDQITKDTIIIFEISAHQLSQISVSPHIGIFLNIYEEHLDYYQTLDNYFKAKSNITKFQNEKDYVLIGNNLPILETKAKKIVINNDIHFDMQLLGEHNQYNANFVYYVANKLLNIDDKTIRTSFAEFKNLKHRLDYIGKFNEIDYYDDSISTIPQATINAINSIKNINTVLIGGMDRGINYDVLINYINSNHELNYILMYASGKRIYDKVKTYENCYYVENLEQATALAKTITKKKMACLLSPAAASYDSFKNFEERGDKFIEYIAQ